MLHIEFHPSHFIEGVVLELTHNHGSESNAEFSVNNGNVEPHRGFGHLAVMTPDVYAACEELEKRGVKFQKRPDEGRMKGLAFVLGKSCLAFFLSSCLKFFHLFLLV